MSATTVSRTEIAERGEALYNQKIRSSVEHQHDGKFLVLDVDTGEFEIDADDLAATKRLKAKLPNAVLYGLQIGSPVAYRLGGLEARRAVSDSPAQRAGKASSIQ